jgi:aminoglycoside phosphotransferase (APT) family kinase protein
VWFHGDIASANLVIAFTFFRGRSRATFREAMGLDDDAWARARGWAAWKALVMLAQPGGASVQAEHREVLDAVLADRAADH